MTNALRGEMEITLGGKTFNTKLSIDGIVRLERQLGKGIIKYATALSQGDTSLTEVITVLTVAIRGGGNKIEEAEVKKLAWETGVAQSLAIAGEVLANALVGGQSAGNEEAAES